MHTSVLIGIPCGGRVCESRVHLIRGDLGMASARKQETGLGDARLDGRAALVFERIVAAHSVVLKKVGGKRAGEVAVGRLLASSKVDTEGLLAPHVARTTAAVRGLRIVAAQDTTEINFSGRDHRRRGLGPAGDGVSKGFFIHPVIAIDADTEAVLGVVGAELWTRDPAPAPTQRNVPFKDKESARWLRGAECAADRLSSAASVIVVGDRESDIYEVFASQPAGVDVIIRAHHNRTLATGGGLFETMGGFDVLGGACVHVASKGIGDKGRLARVLIKSGAVAIAKPKQQGTAAGRSQAVAQVALNTVEVVEVNAPAGVEPLWWRLTTTLAVATLADACEVVRLYRLRWRIEETFRALKKDGLRLEETQVTEASAVMNLAVLALAAAVRIIQLVDARDGSPRPASDIIAPDQIDAVAAISTSLEGKTERQKNTWTRGTLPWLAWVVARLGGWNCYGRKPGPKTMADGWHSLSHMLDGFRLAKATKDV
jgi:Transposase DDE domain